MCVSVEGGKGKEIKLVDMVKLQHAVMHVAHLIAVGAFTKYGVEAHSTSGQASQPLQEQDKYLPWDVSTYTTYKRVTTYKQGENKRTRTSSRQGWWKGWPQWVFSQTISGRAPPTPRR